MSSPLLIRAALIEDAPAISSLILQFAPAMGVQAVHPDAQRFLDALTPAAIASYVAAPNFQYLAAMVDGQLAGVGAVRDNAHLYHLFVARDFQQRRIAVELWTRLRALAYSNGNPGRFTVNASVGALAVYDRFGFRAVGEMVEKNGLTYQPMCYTA